MWPASWPTVQFDSSVLFFRSSSESPLSIARVSTSAVSSIESISVLRSLICLIPLLADLG